MTTPEPSTHQVPSAPCPNCGAENDAATGVGHSNAPKPGDLTVCFGCGQMLRFDDELRGVELTPEELLDLPDDVRIRLTRIARYLARERKQEA